MLKIVDLKGNHLATIHHEVGEKPRLEIVDESLRQELNALFEMIRNEKVFLITGTRESRDKQVIHRTIRKQVSSSDPDFLKGVRDTITRKKLTIGGRRVRGLLIEEGKPDNERT